MCSSLSPTDLLGKLERPPAVSQWHGEGLDGEEWQCIATATLSSYSFSSDTFFVKPCFCASLVGLPMSGTRGFAENVEDLGHLGIWACPKAHNVCSR